MRIYFVFGAIMLLNSPSFGQEKMEIEGAITLKNSDSSPPIEGTIRYNPTSKDFQGWNGNWKSLTNPKVTVGSGMVTDIDGNLYQTVKIGTQTWMREELRTTRFNDETSIQEQTLNADWVMDNPAWCWYENNHILDLEYGKLYNWLAVDSSSNGNKNICPVGWHVPTDTEWTTLIDLLDPAVVNANIEGTQSLVAGGKMKETGLAHWNADNTGADNESGFTGLGGGHRNFNGVPAAMGIGGYYWSSTSSDSFAWARIIRDNSTVVLRIDYDTNAGFSVRCIKN